MKPTIENLKDTFKIGYEVYEDSIKEASKTYDYYHNRQFTPDQEAILENRGQPKETFNVIKSFSRALIGYFSTVINVPVIKPKGYEDIYAANLLNDVVNQILNENNFAMESEKIKLDGLLSGLMACYISVKETNKVDEVGRKLYKINLEHVPSYELILDPYSIKADYSDARFIHRFKWMPKEEVIKLFGKNAIKDLEAYYNFLNIEEAEFEYKFKEQFFGQFKRADNYLIVHTVMEDDDGNTWSIYWSNDKILKKELYHFRNVKFPYRITKMNDSNKPEFYGIFREILPIQDAINQAIIQIQLMVNSNKAFVQEGAVENIEEFTKVFNRVNAVIPVLNLAGIKIEHLDANIQQQYLILNNALDRIQRLIGINPSFLGLANASDSGRKVKLQQVSSIITLRYITSKLETFYKALGWDLVHLIKQYYTAHQVIRITDESVGDRWIEINKPMVVLDGQGKPRYAVMEATDKEGNPLTDENGNPIVVPLNEPHTDITVADVDLEVQTSAYNDEDERNQLLLETMLNGPIGQALMTVNPAAYFKIASLTIKNIKSKYSPEISQLLEATAQMLTPQPQMQQMLGMASGQKGQQQLQQMLNEMPNSQELKLPQNTNELGKDYGDIGSNISNNL